MPSRNVTQGRQVQGENEQIAYTVDTTNWGASPTSPSVEVLDVTAKNAVVTTTVMPTNVPTVSGNIITLSLLKNLQAGHLYRVEVSFTLNGNVEEAWFEVQAED